MVGQLWNGVRFNQYGTLDCLEVYDRSEKLDEKWWETEKQYLKLGRLFHLFIVMHTYPKEKLLRTNHWIN